MPPSVSLKINSKLIELDKFTASFISSTSLGLLSNLRGLEHPNEARKIGVVVYGQNVRVEANGVEISMNVFIRDFVRNTVVAMAEPLRGVDADIKNLELILLTPLTD